MWARTQRLRATQRLPRWTGPVLLLALVIFAIMYKSASEIQAYVDNQIAYENDVFCEQIGLPKGTEQHVYCVKELSRLQVRIEKIQASSGLF